METCRCNLKPGMSVAELRNVENCQHPNWICNELDKARRQAEKREASIRRIARLKDSAT